ncbi:MAG: universal stress protein [Planctomycetaceae bacterium]|nr:universal stress protein [Planctomycetaceae bacterium]
MNWLPRKTVVVPVDFSSDSFAALDTAAKLAADKADLRVIHVLPELEPAEPGVIWQTIDDADREEHAAKALEAELLKRGHQGLAVRVCFGDPGHQIADYAEELDAGLIVISSKGKSALKRLLLGSVADRVVRLAHCPVLVLKR